MLQVIYDCYNQCTAAPCKFTPISSAYTSSDGVQTQLTSAQCRANKVRMVTHQRSTLLKIKYQNDRRYKDRRGKGKHILHHYPCKRRLPSFHHLSFWSIIFNEVGRLCAAIWTLFMIAPIALCDTGGVARLKNPHSKCRDSWACWECRPT